MRGEEGEFNPWQRPMGRGASRLLEAMGVEVRRCADADEVLRGVEEGLEAAFRDDVAVAILVAQSFLGVKPFQDRSGPGREEG
jgi:sulfopyruvate decarboxylase TPP-binding subunit